MNTLYYNIPYLRYRYNLSIALNLCTNLNGINARNDKEESWTNSSALLHSSQPRDKTRPGYFGISKEYEFAE